MTIGHRDPLALALLRGSVSGLATVALDVMLRRGRPAGARPWVEGVLAGAAAAVRELPGSRRTTPRPPRHAEPRPGRGAAVSAPSETGRLSERAGAVRKLYAGAAALSFSVVADSTMEHYRGGFYNPMMYVGPTVAALTLGGALQGFRKPRATSGRAGVFAAAVAAGFVGTGFHAYNILRREGGLSWQNLFYAAPLAAPFGITAAGLFGLAGGRLADQDSSGRLPRFGGMAAGPLLAGGAAVGLVGTAAEAALLHFRGAFHNPYMYLPVTIPPLAAAATGAALLDPTGVRIGMAGTLLWSTVALGFIGMGFHAYGVQRNMGGWHNWSQNLLEGPPLPAPPSFTGMALAGLAGLALTDGGTRG